MLLDDKQAAISDLVAAWQESIDLYADAAERVDEPELRELFEGIGGRRRDDVARLAEIIRDSGELPRAPYADREELRRLFTHVKAALSGDDGRRVFLDDRIEGERRLGSLVDDALELDFPDDTRAFLATLRTRVDEVIARLTAAASGEERS